MGYGDQMHEIPLEVKLATENSQLKAELERTQKALEMAKADMRSALAQANEFKLQARTTGQQPPQPNEWSELRTRVEDLENALHSVNDSLVDAKNENDDLQERYDNLQEMVKLYRKLVKVPVEDVGYALSIDEYMALAARTDNRDLLDVAGGASSAADLLHLSVAAMGLCGEAGEFADLVKKHIHQGHDLDLEKLKKELGDVLWYWAKACRQLGLSGDAVALANIEKLKQRYGKGFSTEASKARVDENPEQQCESISAAGSQCQRMWGHQGLHEAAEGVGAQNGQGFCRSRWP